MFFQILNKFIRSVPYHIVHIDKFFIIIVYNSLFGLQIEEQGTSSNKRFIIKKIQPFFRKQSFDFRKQLSFTADPFQKRYDKFIFRHNEYLYRDKVNKILLFFIYSLINLSKHTKSLTIIFRKNLHECKKTAIFN